MRQIALYLALLCNIPLLFAEEQHFDQIVADHPYVSSEEPWGWYPKSAGIPLTLPENRLPRLSCSFTIAPSTHSQLAYIDICREESERLHIQYRIIIKSSYSILISSDIQHIDDGLAKADARRFTLLYDRSQPGGRSLDIGLFAAGQAEQPCSIRESEKAIVKLYLKDLEMNECSHLVFSCGGSEVIYQDCTITNW